MDGRIESEQLAALTGIRKAMGVDVFVADQVRSEALKVGHGSGDDVIAEPELVNLQPLIESGVLQVAHLNGDAEFTALVGLARDLGDGEAECGAIAACRGWRVATDDKKAMRVLSAFVSAVLCARMSALMQTWVQRANPDDDFVRVALRDIRLRARFEPSGLDPLCKWWMRSLM